MPNQLREQRVVAPLVAYPTRNDRRAYLHAIGKVLNGLCRRIQMCVASTPCCLVDKKLGSKLIGFLFNIFGIHCRFLYVLVRYRTLAIVIQVLPSVHEFVH